MSEQMIARRRYAVAWIGGLALFVPPAVDAQAMKTVTGTAMYRERIALPPDAIFEAVLEDMSRADAPAVVIGRTRLDKPGQPPFKFSIEYDPRKLWRVTRIPCARALRRPEI